MNFFYYAVVAVFLLSHGALPFSIALSQNSTQQELPRRGAPPIPPRPANVGNQTFHTSQFDFFEEIGFVPGSPAVESSPVFLFGRAKKTFDPCYPESAVVIGSNPPEPNPGTDSSLGPASMNPGADCTNPGVYYGQYSLGNAFPVYVGASFCGSTWRVNYAVYYVHEGAVLEGHKHDWEGITVVFRQELNSKDWWYRDSAIYQKHHWRDHFTWGDLETVDIMTQFFSEQDIRNEDMGNYRSHPKVYVGFYSHASFRAECRFCRKNMLATFSEESANKEYRSAHWWRLPEPEDLHLWSEIDPSWDYGRAKNTPPNNKNNMCKW